MSDKKYPGVLDLDKYRQRRVENGTWPPKGLDDFIGYWREFLKLKDGVKSAPPPFDPPKSGRYSGRDDDDPVFPV